MKKLALALSLSLTACASSGSRVVLAPVPGSAAVAVRVLFYSGSIDDPKGKEGLTALTANLMAEGGTKELAYPALLRALYPMAASIGVQVSNEQTVFVGVCHRDHLDRFLPLLAGVIREPRLDEGDFNRIKQDMLNDIEKRLRATDDENLGKEMLNLMLYPKEHPYGHFVGGTVEGLKSITLADVRAHLAKVFGKSRVLPGAGGAADDAVARALTSALEGLPEGAPRVAEIPAVEKPSRMQVLIAEKPSKAVAISMGFPIDVVRGAPDWPSLGLVQSYFGEHRQFHGVLMSEMREKRGLNYGDYAYVEKFVQDGWSTNALPNVARRRQHFEIWIRPVDPKDAVFAIRLALHYLDRLVDQGLDQAGVDGTRQFLEGYTRLWDLTPNRRLGYALDDRFYGTEHHLEQYRAALAGLTPDKVNAAIRAHLVKRPLYVAIVAQDAEGLRQALIAGAKTEKVYQAKVDDSVLREDESVSVLPLGIEASDVKVVKVEELFER